jgi:hypothetical protein
MSTYNTTNKINTIYNIFNRKKILLPVIHIINIKQTLTNAHILHQNNVKGCWIINHSCSDEVFADAFNQLKASYPNLWVGINYLGRDFVPIIFCSRFNIKPDGFWFDNVGVSDQDATKAHEIRALMKQTGLSDVLVFGSICFKYQRQPKSVELTTKTALDICDVITTSGKGTGIDHDPSDINKFRTMKEICTGNSYLAVASGISESNISDILEHVDIFMVNTSIAKDEIFIPDKVANLVKIINNYEYNLMPNTKNIES